MLFPQTLEFDYVCLFFGERISTIVTFRLPLVLLGLMSNRLKLVFLSLILVPVLAFLRVMAYPSERSNLNGHRVPASKNTRVCVFSIAGRLGSTGLLSLLLLVFLPGKGSFFLVPTYLDFLSLKMCFLNQNRGTRA